MGSAEQKSQALVLRKPTAIAAFDLQELDAEAAAIIKGAVPENTKKAYRLDVKAFEVWCAHNGQRGIPSTDEVVLRYLMTLVRLGRKMSTIDRMRASLSKAHRLYGAPHNPAKSELVSTFMSGTRKKLGQKRRKMKGVLLDDVLGMIERALGRGDLLGLRDAAIVGLGFSTSCRRSEIVALNVEDLSFENPKGMTIFLKKSKTDQEAKGRVVAVQRVDGKSCPVRIVERWISKAKIRTGPLFRVLKHGVLAEKRLGAAAVLEVVRRHLPEGADPNQYGAHSMRRGFITQARRNGMSIEDIKKQSGHKSDDVLREYIEDADLFVMNASKDVWTKKEEK